MMKNKVKILFKRIIAIIALVAILPLVSVLNLFNAHAEENVESITANKANIDIFNDDFLELARNVTIMPQDAKQDVRFICSDNSLVEIDQKWGVLIPNNSKTGTVTITAIATNGTDDESDDKTTTFTVTIKEKEEISYVIFDPYSNCYVEEKTKNYNLLTQDNQEWSSWSFNVVTEDIECDSEIILGSSSYQLILMDGKTLTAKKGIQVLGSLTIFSQSLDKETMGKIITTGPSDATEYDTRAGIEIDDDGRDLIIYGGNIEATGSRYSAGIGGHLDHDGGNVTIYGGNITAKAGLYASGIGGGAGNKDWYHSGAKGGNVTIYGGEITAIAGGNGAMAIGHGSTEDQKIDTDSEGELTLGVGMISKTGDNEESAILSNDFDKNYAQVYVDPDYVVPSVTKLELDKNELELILGAGNGTITRTILPNESNKTTVWTSSDESVATVTNRGVVKAVGVGNATITATATNGTKDTSDDLVKTCKVTVKNPDPITYLAYDENKKVFSEEALDEYEFINEESEILSNGTRENHYKDATMNPKWYVVEGEVNVDHLFIIGNVHIILKDNSILNCRGIELTKDNNLTIYAQSTGKNMGALIAKAEGNGVGIGASEDKCGKLTINGGAVTASGVDGAAGIGGSESSVAGGTIIINGGAVTAIGGYKNDQYSYSGNAGRAIYSGSSWNYDTDSWDYNDDIGTLYINEGMVVYAGDDADHLHKVNDYTTDRTYKYMLIGDSPSHNITTLETEHGTIEVESTGKAGKEVIITTLPDNRYKVKDIKVKYGVVDEIKSVEDLIKLIGNAIFRYDSMDYVCIDPTFGNDYVYCYTGMQGYFLLKKDNPLNTDRASEGIYSAVSSNITWEFKIKDNAIKEITVTNGTKTETFNGGSQYSLIQEVPVKLVKKYKEYSFIMPDYDAEISIEFEEYTFRKITYVLDEGTINEEYEIEYAEEVGYTLPTNVTKEGYSFIGWYDNAEFTGEAITLITDLETGDKTFYACFTNDPNYFVNDTINTINSLPTEISLNDKDAIIKAREKYEALTKEQKESFDADTLAKLIAAEDKIDILIVDEVTNEITTLPEVNTITFDDKDAILDARKAYEALTKAQKAKITSETLNILKAAEAKLEIESWEDVIIPNGIYKFYFVFDENNLLTATPNYYWDGDIKGGDIFIADASSPSYEGKGNQLWNIEKFNDNSFAIFNMHDTLINKRLLDGSGWDLNENGYTTLGLDPIDATLKEANTNIFRFAKRKDVESGQDEYYIRCVQEEKNKYKSVLAYDDNAEAIVLRPYVAGYEKQLWKLELIKTDQAYADEMQPLYNNLPELISSTNIDTFSVSVRHYAGLTNTQRGLISDEIKTKMEKYKIAFGPAELINALPEAADITLNHENVVNNAKDKYNNWEIKDEHRALLDQNLKDKLTAVLAEFNTIKSANDSILNLPAVGDLTINNKNALTNANDKYEALTNDQKAKIPTDTVNKLNSLLTKMVSLERIKAVNDLIDALPNVENVKLENKEAIEAAKKAYNELSNDEKKAVTYFSKLEAVYKEVTDIEAATNVASEFDTLADVTNPLENEDEIIALKESYDKLTEDQKAKLPQETKAKIEELYKPIKEIIDVKDDINTLPNVAVVSWSDDDALSSTKETVEAARKAYDALSPEQKAKVSKEILDKLVAAEKEIVDIETAKVVGTQVNELPTADEVSLDDIEKIQAAREAYEKLTDNQKAKVSESNNAIIVIEKKVANIIDNQIIDLGNVNDITLDDKDAILAARANYESLTKEQKAYVNEEQLNQLIAIEAKVSLLQDEFDTEVANAISSDIGNLPDVTNVSLDNKETVLAIKEAYDALTDAQKAKISKETKEKLEALIEELETVSNANDGIITLPVVENVELSDKDAVAAAKEAYEALTDAQKEKLPEETKEKYEAVVAEFETVSNANDSIVLLPNVDNVQLSDMNTIEAALENYNYLTEEQKEKLPAETKAKLDAVVTEYETVSSANDSIVELPAVADVALTDKEEIEETKKAYDALTDAQKAKLPAETKAKLDAVVEEIEVVSNANDEIVELPVVADVALTDKEEIEAVKESYDSLTDTQKAKLPAETKAKLEAVVAEIETVSNANDKIVAIPEVSQITIENKETIEAARVSYNALTPAQQAKIPAETKAKLEAAENEIKEIEAIKISQRGNITSYTREYNSNELQKGVDASHLFKTAANNSAQKEAVVKTNEFSVSFDSNAVNTISKSKVSILAKLSTENLKIQNAQMIFEVVLNGSTFANGKAKVTLPFNKKVPNDKVAKVYYVESNGNLTDMNATFTDENVVFETNHFSIYAVVFEDAKVGLPDWSIAAMVYGGFILVCGICYLFVFVIFNEDRRRK